MRVGSQGKPASDQCRHQSHQRGLASRVPCTLCRILLLLAAEVPKLLWVVAQAQGKTQCTSALIDHWPAQGILYSRCPWVRPCMQAATQRPITACPSSPAAPTPNAPASKTLPPLRACECPRVGASPLPPLPAPAGEGGSGGWGSVSSKQHDSKPQSGLEERGQAVRAAAVGARTTCNP